MEQIRYDMEIVKLLLKNRSHARAIAKRLNINHMMAVRKLKTLLKSNVVDFIQEGRNKTFFLKDTVEGRNYIILAENYYLLRLINKHPTLRRIIERIQRDKRIKLAIIFGSYAKNLARKDSDIDMFIETNDPKIKTEFLRIDSRLSIKIGKLNNNNNLAKEIEKNHVIIKGVEQYCEKSKLFEKIV